MYWILSDPNVLLSSEVSAIEKRYKKKGKITRAVHGGKEREIVHAKALRRKVMSVVSKLCAIPNNYDKLCRLNAINALSAALLVRRL